MKKSNIFITAVIGIVVGGWSISSWLVGQQIEAKLPTYSKYLQAELWKVIEDQPYIPLQFELINYKRGIFSSTAQYNILKSPAGNDQLLINVKIQHGPFPLNSLFHFSLKPKVASIHAEFANSPIIHQLKSEVTNRKTPIKLNIDLYDENNFTFDFNLAPINIKKDRNNRFIIKGFRFLGDIRKNTANSKLEFKIDNIEIKSGSGNIALTDLKLDYFIKPSNQHTISSIFSIFSIEKQTLSITRLKFGGFDGVVSYPDTNISNLIVNSNYILKDNNYDIQSEFRLGDLSFGSFDLGSFNYNININKLNAKATDSLIAALQQRLNRFSHNYNELGETIDNSFFSIMEGQPTLSISPINWKNAKGELTASLNIEMQKGNILSYDPIAVIQSFIKSAKFNLTASRPMLEHGMAQIESIKEHYLNTHVSRIPDFEATKNIIKNKLTNYRNLKQQFQENEEAMEQFTIANPMYIVIMLASINIDDTKLTSDISYENDFITVNGGKPKSLDDFIAYPLLN